MTPAAESFHDAGFQDACAAIARRHDRERYLACLFAPPGRRDALLAVLAANHEIAKTAEVVSDPTIGRIRLQWWHETFDGIEAGQPRVHEVAMPLAQAVFRHGLRLDCLRTVVDAREADLDSEPPATLEALEAYARATAGELHAALAGILRTDPAAAAAAGTAWGLLGLMRAAPALIAAGRAPFPAALLQQAGLTTEYIRDSISSVSLNSLVSPVMQVANRCLRSARESAAFREPRFRPLRLLADRAADHAAALGGVGNEPIALQPTVPAWLVWRYAGRMLRYRLGG